MANVKSRIHLDEALQLVNTEQNHIDNKLKAFDRFSSGITRISTTSRSPSSFLNPNDGAKNQSQLVAINDNFDDDKQIKKIRSLFAKTVRPHSIEDIDHTEPLLVTIREEFGEKVALALAPSTNQQFTNELKTAILSSVEQCQSNLKVMNKGLEFEKSELEKSIGLSKSLSENLISDEQHTRLENFDSLKSRHEELDEFRNQCEQFAADRQTTLHTKTNNTFTASMSHDTVISYLYQPLPVSYPVLSGIVQLIRLCDNHQQTVRKYLTRCV